RKWLEAPAEAPAPLKTPALAARPTPKPAESHRASRTSTAIHSHSNRGIRQPFRIRLRPAVCELADLHAAGILSSGRPNPIRFWGCAERRSQRSSEETLRKNM